MMVYLKAQPDFRSISMLMDRKAKMNRMYSELVKTATLSQGQLVTSLKQRGYGFQSYYINNSILVSNADGALATELQQSVFVRKVTYNTHFRMKPIGQALNSPARAAIRAGAVAPKIEAGLEMIKANQVWNLKISGAGIIIGSLDSGVQWDHPALIRQYRGNDGRTIRHNYNWHDAIRRQTNKTIVSPCGYNLLIPCDDTGHGTHTTGTMVGNDGVSNIIGVAPSARWMACRNMDNGVGTVATYTECFEFFFAPYLLGGDPQKDGRPDYAPHILNNSWGCEKSEGCQGDEFGDILKIFYQAGTMVVVSAGNNGLCGTISSPPATQSELTLSVGSVDSRLTSSVFSSRGPSTLDGGIGPDLVAPGEFVRSSVPGNTYREQSGTSMSTPHVSGAVALLWSANRNLIGRIAETVQLLKATAVPLKADESCGGTPGSTIPNNTFGYGLVDALGAVQAGIKFR